MRRKPNIGIYFDSFLLLVLFPFPLKTPTIYKLKYFYIDLLIPSQFDSWLISHHVRTFNPPPPPHLKDIADLDELPWGKNRPEARNSIPINPISLLCNGLDRESDLFSSSSHSFGLWPCASHPSLPLSSPLSPHTHNPTLFKRIYPYPTRTIEIKRHPRDTENGLYLSVWSVTSRYQINDENKKIVPQLVRPIHPFSSGKLFEDKHQLTPPTKIYTTKD